MESGTYKLKGYDTFDEEYYDIAGEYSESEVYQAAEAKLKQIEETQPAASSGGQDINGIQDRIYIVRPDGTMFRYIPMEPEEGY